MPIISVPGQPGHYRDLESGLVYAVEHREFEVQAHRLRRKVLLRPAVQQMWRLHAILAVPDGATHLPDECIDVRLNYYDRPFSAPVAVMMDAYQAMSSLDPALQPVALARSIQDVKDTLEQLTSATRLTVPETVEQFRSAFRDLQQGLPGYAKAVLDAFGAVGLRLPRDIDVRNEDECRLERIGGSDTAEIEVRLFLTSIRPG